MGAIMPKQIAPARTDHPLGVEPNRKPAAALLAQFRV